MDLETLIETDIEISIDGEIQRHGYSDRDIDGDMNTDIDIEI